MTNYIIGVTNFIFSVTNFLFSETDFLFGETIIPFPPPWIQPTIQPNLFKSALLAELVAWGTFRGVCPPPVPIRP